MADAWQRLAIEARRWADAEGALWRDVVVLVPFVELLAPARRAFAALGEWMPRIETTRTLAESLGPLSAASVAGPAFDSALDVLLASQTLARQPWGADWARRDRRGFERGAARVVATAQALGRAAAAAPPELRAAWWDRCRAALPAVTGPGGRERLLAQVAVEWAAAAPAPDTDRLFALEASAWIAIEAGGAEPLALGLLGASVAPALVLDLDVAADLPFDGVEGLAEAPAFALCDGFEDEASAAAAQVLAHLEHDERPVAVVAQDRVLVRRIRALLERHGVRIADETGWKLATTRAGAAVMQLLAAARHGAGSDDVLAWLKVAPFAAVRAPASLAELEARCRRAGVARRDAMASLTLGVGAERLLAAALDLLAGLTEPARRSLPSWLDAVASALEQTGAMAALRDDAAGRQVLLTLGLEPTLAADRRDALTGEIERLSLADFTRWVDAVLDGATFRPPLLGSGDEADADLSDVVDVVVTPLVRAILRPFAALVLPGADDVRLGGRGRDDLLLPAAAAAELGVPSAGSRRDAELLAFAQILRLPHVTLLRRRGDGAEPVAASAFVERLRLALAAHGRDLRPWHDPRSVRRLAATPVHRGAPSVPAALLPRRLSASAFDALRTCPYRFFARSVLGLGEADELDDEIEKRDYGSWLHAVLDVFHRERAEAAPGPHADAAADRRRLLEIGESVAVAGGLDAAGLLPFTATFTAFVPRYVAWLHDREAAGWLWSAGEVEHALAPAELDGVELYGRIDRIDRRSAGAAGEAVVHLIDYKTGSASGLKATVREPFEDTQLAFYAALVGGGKDAVVRASYLALDGTHRLEEIAHDGVEASARALVAGAADELRRMRAGEGLPALGEGKACDYCEARGLCRRDHWAAMPALPLPTDAPA